MRARLARFWWIGAAFILLAGSVYHYHPSERILGQSDAGSYALSAVALARGEGFGPNRSLLDEMPAEVRERVVENKHPLGLRDAALELRPRAFYLEWQLGDRKPGDLVPRFPPGYPAVLSLGYGLAGWKGLFAVNSLLMLLSGLLVSTLACKYAGPSGGILAALLWTVFPLNVWIANTTLAEPLVLLLGLAAVTAWVWANESAGRWWPLVLGFCVGLGPVVKLDALPWLLLPLVYAWEHRREGIARATLPGLAALPFLLASGLVLLAADSGYLKENVYALVRQPAVWIVVVGSGCTVVMAVGAFWRLRTFEGADLPASSVTDREPVLPRCAKWVAFAIFAGVLGYFYFVRPRAVGTDQIYWAPLGRTVPSLREVSLVRLGWYLPPFALWTAMLGAGAAVLWARETWLRAFALIGLGTLLFVSYDHINFPVEPFACRRYLPQAVPVLIVVLAGAGGWWLWAPRLRRWARVLAVVVTVYACGHGLWVNSRMNSRADAEGVLPQLRSISETVGPKGLVVMRAFGPLLELAPVLALGFQCDVLPVRPTGGGGGQQALDDYLREQEARGRTLWLWTSTPGDSLGLKAHAIAAPSRRDFTVPFLRMSTTERPFSWDRRTWKSVLRQVSYADQVTAAPAVSSQ